MAFGCLSTDRIHNADGPSVMGPCIPSSGVARASWVWGFAGRGYVGADKAQGASGWGGMGGGYCASRPSKVMILPHIAHVALGDDDAPKACCRWPPMVQGSLERRHGGGTTCHRLVGWCTPEYLLSSLAFGMLLASSTCNMM
jgi:hypothetical protein